MTETVQFFLALGLMISFAKLMGYISYRLQQPAVLGELLAGLILGPTILNLLGLDFFFTHGADVKHTLIEIAELGVLLLMFMAGMEVELKSLLGVRKVAVSTGLLGVIVPLVMITPVVMYFGYSFEKALFVGILLASMSTSISAQVMFELGVIQRKEGITLLGAALVDDAIVILLLSLYIAINPNGIILDAQSRSVLEVILRIIAFLVVSVGFSLTILPRIINYVSRLPISQGLLMLALVSTFLMSWAAEYFGGIAGITGAFIAGLGFQRSTRHLVDQVEHGLHSINYSFFVPLFFVSIGLRADLRLLTLDLLPFALIMTILAIISKIVGAGGGSLLGGFSRISSLRIGLGMISRGEVGLIIASIGVSLGILQAEVFTVIVFVVLVTTILTPPLVRWSFKEPKAPVAAEQAA